VRTDALDAEVAASGVTKQMEKDLQAGLFICKNFCGICAITEFRIEKHKQRGMAIHAIIAKYGHVKKPGS